MTQKQAQDAGNRPASVRRLADSPGSARMRPMVRNGCFFLRITTTPFLSNGRGPTEELLGIVQLKLMNLFDALDGRFIPTAMLAFGQMRPSLVRSCYGLLIERLTKPLLTWARNHLFGYLLVRA